MLKEELLEALVKIHHQMLQKHIWVSAFWAAPFLTKHRCAIFRIIYKYYRTCFINIITVLTIEAKKHAFTFLDTNRRNFGQHIPLYIHTHKILLYWGTQCYRRSHELHLRTHWFLKDEMYVNEQRAKDLSSFCQHNCTTCFLGASLVLQQWPLERMGEKIDVLCSDHDRCVTFYHIWSLSKLSLTIWVTHGLFPLLNSWIVREQEPFHVKRINIFIHYLFAGEGGLICQFKDHESLIGCWQT